MHVTTYETAATKRLLSCNIQQVSESLIFGLKSVAPKATTADTAATVPAPLIGCIVLDAETKGSTLFRNTRAMPMGCSDQRGSK